MVDELIRFFSQDEHKSQNTKLVEGYADAFDAYSIYGDNADSSIDWSEMKRIFGDDMDIAKEYVEKCFR